MSAGGFTFVFVRFIVKLFTNWNNTTPTHVAGAPCSSPAIPSADTSARDSGGALVSVRLGLSSSPTRHVRKIERLASFRQRGPRIPRCASGGRFPGGLPERPHRD